MAQSRPSSRASSSSGTRYSINLDALLGQSKNSSAISLQLLDNDAIDVVNTDDIDGPTDFTQNMEYWMRAKLPNVMEPQQLEDPAIAGDLEEYIASGNEDEGTTKAQGSEDSLQDQSDQHAFQDGRDIEGFEEHLESSKLEQEPHKEDETPDSLHESSALERLPENTNDDSQLPGMEDDERSISEDSVDQQSKVTSFLDDLPDAEGTFHLMVDTPAPQRSTSHQNLLPPQPTVEDYEDTPLKLRSSSVPHSYPSPSEGRYAPRKSETPNLRQQLNQQQISANGKINTLEYLLASARAELDRTRAESKSALDGQRRRAQETLQQRNLESASENNMLRKRIEQLESERVSQEYGKDVRLQESEEANEKKLSDQKSLFENRLKEMETQLQQLQQEHEDSQSAASKVLKVALEVAQAKHDKELKSEKTLSATRASALEICLGDLRNQLDTAVKTSEATLEVAQAEHHKELEGEKTRSATRASELKTCLGNLQQQFDSAAKISEATLKAAHSKHHEELEGEKTRSAARVLELEISLGDLRNQLDSAAKTSETTLDILQTAQVTEMHEKLVERDARIAELEGHLSASQATLQQSRAAAETKEQQTVQSMQHQRDEMAEVTTRFQCQVTGLDATLCALRAQMADSRAELEQVRHEANVEQENNRRAQDAHAVEMAAVNARARTLDAKAEKLEKEKADAVAGAKILLDVQAQLEMERGDEEARATDLFEQLDAMREEVNELEMEKDDAESRATDLSHQLDALRKENKEQLDAMQTRAEDAIKQVGEMLKQERKAKVTAKKEAKIAQDEADTARKELDQNRTTSTQDQSQIRQKLERAKAAAKAAEADAQAAREELRILKADTASINKQVDQRIMELIHRRENEWARRFEMLVKDRNMMGKALMHEWGEKELGFDEPQAYRYRFVGK